MKLIFWMKNINSNNKSSLTQARKSKQSTKQKDVQPRCLQCQVTESHKTKLHEVANINPSTPSLRPFYSGHTLRWGGVTLFRRCKLYRPTGRRWPATIETKQIILHSTYKQRPPPLLQVFLLRYAWLQNWFWTDKHLHAGGIINFHW